MKVNQSWTPYWEWEDWINGMWRKLLKENEPDALEIAFEFTGNHILYGAAMGEVLIKWPRTMVNSLTNSGINKRAFLGHCAVQYKAGVPEYITRRAWKMLTDEQRMLADRQAQKHINKWLKKYEKKDKVLRFAMGTEVLPLWDSR